tara:strand:- start:7697 stop:8071 length:375 start_codon:yes stop_codon:yes gene_type:complete
MSITTLVILVAIGLFAGIAGGMIGIGGGLVIVPCLVYFLGLSQFEAQGTSVATLLLPIGVLAAYNYNQAEVINWKYALIIALTFIVGGYIGSKLTLSFLSESTVKKMFGVIMLIGAIKMIFFSK